MKILFLCTAHNSLSQRLYLSLLRKHEITIEYALSDELILSAVTLTDPDLVICPFLTTLVPKEVYDNYLTLIVHPGPPGDIGPSALDWVLMGDDGSVNNSTELLRRLESEPCRPGRSYWGVTILQAIEEFDAGPVWAFDQFEIDIDQPGLTKAELYRGSVTQAAITATIAAIARIQDAAITRQHPSPSPNPFPPSLQADPEFRLLSVTDRASFKGGKLHHRPLLKAVHREFDPSKHTAEQVSRRIRCGDSQPGVLSRVFGGNLYVYGGTIEDNAAGRRPTTVGKVTSKVLGFRNKAICIATCDGRGVWITHIRRPKTKYDKTLWPKVPAISGLMGLGLLKAEELQLLYWSAPLDWSLSSFSTHQEVWVDIEVDGDDNKTAYLTFDFYNGAMSTENCSQLIQAMDYVLSLSTLEDPLQAVVLMGGSYFSNGIALNVIEAAADPALESWQNINRINDVVYYLLHEFPSRGILTVAAIRGNAAAGGVALATACDIVIAGANVVLNPAYRAVGLYGSEYHTISYSGRCGAARASKILRAMTPMSPLQAQAIGLVDYVFPDTGEVLDDHIRNHVDLLLQPSVIQQGRWKRNVDLSPGALALARSLELGQMSQDFWSPRSARYHSRRFDFVRKIKPSQTPLRFATHRRKLDVTRRDEEETDLFDSVEYFRKTAEEQTMASLRTKLNAEMGEMVSKREATRRLKHDSAVELVSQSCPESPVSIAEKKSEHTSEADMRSSMFDCYYSLPVDEDFHKKPVLELPTPPETPLSPGEVVDRMFGIL
ncbi:hydrogenase maturation factor hoxX like protein [Zymoseptoria brevis]|uniref:Hydrogenase maturation factor hoxX like protein n=1 Tax=Zymoseptoria brevis TaxID=1047168 RepID=A0A0F4G9G7_9PEZI|nr:hydrogenase maturation factor hoxX like protein [Zymoseptoria brevis]